MRTLITTLITVLVSSASLAQCDKLFISEYLEGSGSNKALELYNPSDTVLDLSNFSLYRYNNGSTTPTDSLHLTGNLASKASYVVGNPGADTSIQNRSDTTHSITFFNGDDAIELRNKTNQQSLDIIGVIGVDPGSGWTVGTGATNNNTLVRMSNIQSGTTYWSLGATQWNVFPIDMTDSLGNHHKIPCCVETYDTLTVSACESYTTPSGSVWTTSRSQTDVIPNAAGCDSFIFINLTILEHTRDYIYPNAINSYTSPSGKYTWDSSGVYRDTIPNAAGCDSVIRIFLDITKRYFVNPSVSTSGNGQTWGAAFSSFDEALIAGNSTIEPVEIWLKSGTYYPGGQTNTNRDSAFVVTNPFLSIYGGFSGVETELEQRNSAVNPTVICGDIGKSGDSTDNSYHLLILMQDFSAISGFEGEGSEMTVDGILFKDANADGITTHTYYGTKLYQNEGGAVVIYNSWPSLDFYPSVSNCGFESNFADYGGGIYCASKTNGYCMPFIHDNTFKNNSSKYGTLYMDASSFSAVNPYIVNCVFDQNMSKTSGGAIYIYAYGGESYPLILNCVFNKNQAASHGGAIYNNGYAGDCYPYIFGSTFVQNSATSSAGAIYNFGLAGNCEPVIENSIFYGNLRNANDDHQHSELFNYNADALVEYSSMQRGSATYTTSAFNYLGGGSGNLFEVSPGFFELSDRDGDDNIWRTSDDGLRLSDTSALINAGTYGFELNIDILNATRDDSADIGAYEYIACGLQSPLATDVKTHTASQASEDDGYICYCNSDNELLLALDTFGSGAVISPAQVKLYIGNPSTLSYNSSGGMITNPSGGVVLERRWDVDPTTQPSSDVGVRYFYTNSEYNAVVTAMANLTNPTTISSPSQLQFYKVKGGSSATFPNPHDSGVYGIVLTNGLYPDTTTWVAGVHGVQDHFAEYEVSSFSGGGGGGGGGAAPLPVELIKFTAQAASNHTGQLDWSTATEVDNSHFVLERSYNAYDFEDVATIQGAGNSQQVLNYGYLDNSIDPSMMTVYYRLRQVDFDGTQAFSPIRKIDFTPVHTQGFTKVYPNPTHDVINIAFPEGDEAEGHEVVVMDNIGKVLYRQTTDASSISVDLSDQPKGLYFISIDTGESFKVIKD
ncbi:MAG: lamin tail domain-containing protein [Bacteroidia bacterium]|nr:lamin tail domain-containing protein [Bacteroidia bacterium]